MAVQEHTILVVEDDPLIRDLLVDVLTDAGFRPEAVADGGAAIARLDRAAPSYGAVLLDLMLPRVSGIDVLAYARRVAPSTPVIAVSASPRHLADALDAGARVAVAKPFDLPDLLGVMARHCPPDRD